MILNLENLRRDIKHYRKVDKDLSNRLNILIEFTKIELKFTGNLHKEAKKVKVESFIQNAGVCLKTIQRYKNVYKEKGPTGLIIKKAPGKKAKPITGHTAKLITEWRKKFRWGAEVIQMHLLKDHEIDIKKNRIERFLTKSGLREKYPCTTSKKTKGKIKNEHTKVVKVDVPGEHTQVDTKHLPHIFFQEYLKCYVFNFIDHASNWSFKKAYSSFGYREVQDFFESLLKICPFEIKRLQTDGGVEFTNKYIIKNMDDPQEHPLANFCKKNGIRQVVIPPGEKELQGLVERSHRQDDQELYSRITPFQMQGMNEALEEYCEWRNEHRRFKKLGWKTPNEWLREYYLKRLCPLLKLTPAKSAQNVPEAA